jgi:hypothetical protein
VHREPRSWNFGIITTTASLRRRCSVSVFKWIDNMSSVRREFLARLGWSLGGFRLVLQSSLFFCRDRGAAPLNIERLLDPDPIWSRQFQDLGLSSS